jgi:hypothetical protein
MWWGALERTGDFTAIEQLIRPFPLTTGRRANLTYLSLLQIQNSKLFWPLRFCKKEGCPFKTSERESKQACVWRMFIQGVY